jgi:hypothetical protein
MSLVARNTNEAVVVPMVGSGGLCVWWESGVSLVRLAGICFSRREDIFTFNLFYKEVL